MSGGDAGGGRPRVLLVSPYSIHPMIHGGAVRIGNLARRLAADFELYLLVFVGGSDDPEQRRALEPPCRRVFFQQLPPAGEGGAAARSLPPDAAGFASERVRERIGALVEAHRIEVLILEYAELGFYADLGDLARRPAVVLVEHDVSFRSHQRRGAPPAELALRRRYELGACQRADQVHVMSEEDRRYLASHLGRSDPVRVIPNGVDVHRYGPGDEASRNGLLFVGSFPHPPNLDALDYFLAEVWPRIRAADPGARLTVAGARPPERVLALDGRDGVTVAGEVDDLRPLYRSHRALVVPIRAGSGTRLKILEAFASGLPVASTRVGAEGIEAVDGEHLLLADGAAELASACRRLLTDGDLRRRLAAAGRRLAEERYDWDVVYRRLRSALGELLTEPSPAEPVALPAPPADAPVPEITVVVPARRGGDLLRRCLAAVAEQQSERRWEVVCVSWDGAADAGDAPWPGSPRIVDAGPGPFDQGRSYNLAAAVARGRILAFLAEEAAPADPGWLHKLTAPFFYPEAPAAVQGGIHELMSAGSPPHHLTATRESVRWREEHGGLDFRLDNGAVRRDLWEAFPFREGPLLEDRRWQRQVAAAGQLILPCWAAAVVVERRWTVRRAFEHCLLEGAAWRRLGVRYTARDLRRDLRTPERFGDAWARPREELRQHGRVDRFLPWIRPIALYLGHLVPIARRLLCRTSKSGNRRGVGASPPAVPAAQAKGSHGSGAGSPGSGR